MSFDRGPKIVTDGLVLALDAANPKSYPGSGTTWYDLSGNDNNGTLTNGPTYSSTVNGIIQFDGVNDYAVLSSPITLSSSGASISAWFKITDFSTSNNIDAITLFSDTSNTNNLISFWDGGYGFETNNNSDPVEFFGQTTAPITVSSITSGVWLNFVLVFNSTSYTYLNGTLVHTVAIANGLTFRYIGRAPNGGRQDYPDWHHGDVANVLVYNRALTQQEILQNYNATKNRFAILPKAEQKAIGGEESIITVNGEDYRVHKFNFNDTFEVFTETEVDYLVVGGGGGGGTNRGGGGGAGGFLSGSSTLPVGTYEIEVGLGGSRSGSSTRGMGNNGQPSKITNAGGTVSIVAQGGGGGSGSSGVSGRSGGSGGGGDHVTSSSGGSGTAGQGNNGGSGQNPHGGGGGGAGEAGYAGNAGNGKSGHGGNGLQSDIDGTLKWYAGGGGGGQQRNPNDTSAGLGGLGGGGKGSYGQNCQNDSTPAEPGEFGTGGGGGGGADPGGTCNGLTQGVYRRGEQGGSGVVIIRYKL